MNSREQITALIPTLQGWCDVPKAIALYDMAMAVKPKVAVEIGTWGGRSAFPVALALKELGSGKLICIDPWSEKASVKGQVTEADKNWWGGPQVNHEMIYQDFMQHRESLGLASIIEVQRVESDDFVPPMMELCHIDGNHGPQAYTDTVRYASKIRPGGICVLDDIGWTGGNVQLAADWLLLNGFEEKQKNLGTGAAFIRIK